MRTYLFLVAALLVALFGGGLAHADKRVALVLGNSAYQNTQTLPNPRNDAQDIGAMLEKLGFAVITGIDLDKTAMDGHLAKFARAATGADAALIFYAGHGMQYRGSTYVMPVDAKLEDEVSVTFEMTRVDEMRNALDRATGVRMLILDACRNNPLAEKLMSSGTSRDAGISRGLARLESTQGMLVAYSTQANQTAADGNGRNSPFTAALLKDLPSPNVEVGALFRRVAAEVNAQTGGRQLPELSISILGEFFFARSESDSDGWTAVRNSTRRGDFARFAEKYPASPFAELARARLALIDRIESERAGAEVAARLDQEKAVQTRLLADKAAEVDKAKLATEAAATAEREKAARDAVDKARIAAAQAAQDEHERTRLAAEAREKILKKLAEDQKPARLSLPPPVAVANLAAPPPGDNPVVPPASVIDRGALATGIKRELTRLGCYSSGVDSRWPTGPLTRALKAYALEQKLASPPADPTPDLLAKLRSTPADLCDTACRGRPLNGDGACSAPPPAPAPVRAARRPPVREAPVVHVAPVRHRAQVAAPRRVRPASRSGGGGGCFDYNGQSFC